MLIFYCHNYASFCLCYQWYHILTKLFPVFQILLMHFLPLCLILSLFETSQLLSERHWVIFLSLRILFAKSRLSFNLLQGKEAKYIFWRRIPCFCWNHVLFPLACVRFFIFLLDRVVTFFHYWVFWFLFFSANILELYYSLVHFQIPPVAIQQTFEQPVLLLPWHDCDIINTTCQSKKRAKRNRQQEKSLQIFRCVPHRGTH